MDEFSGIIPALAGVIITVIPALLLHHWEMKKMANKLAESSQEVVKQKYAVSVLQKWLNIHYINELRKAARYMINRTIADRFLIIIGFNGKERFRFISVIVEEHLNEDDFQSIERYKKIIVDEQYIEMMHEAERQRYVKLDVSTMPDSILKNFYLLEGVEHSIVHFLDRQSIDKDNDLVIFSSIATHVSSGFDDLETSLIDAVYQGRISSILRKIKHKEEC